ncbi:MAG: flagellin, partial [Solirubrobacteraceae bacterium]
MSMRVTTQMVDNTSVATIDNDLTAMQSTEEQLASGYKINQPSDDPVGAALSISLSGEISALGAYSQNVNQGTAWMNTASQALQSIAQVTQSVQGLAVEAANGTMNAADTSDAAQQVLADIGEIKSTADAQYDGSYIFSGSDVQSQPWGPQATAADPSGQDAYAGNGDAITYAIAPGTQVQVSSNLYQVLGSGNTGGLAASASNGGGALQTDGSGGLLATLRTIYNDLTGTNGGTQSDLGNQLTNLQTNMSSLEALQATVGTTQDRLQLASSQLTQLSTTDQTQLANVEDADMATETTLYSTQQASY